MKPLDLSTFPLSGLALIEASAGTGKTYSIVHIYLRHIMEGTVSVERLVAVTFTRAATFELTLRIRRGLRDAHAQVTAGSTDSATGEYSSIIQAATDEGHDLATIRSRLRLALLGLDGAPIQTIDALFLKWSREYALQAGADLSEFEATNGIEARQRAVRREIVRLANDEDAAAAWTVSWLALSPSNSMLNKWLKRLEGEVALDTLPPVDTATLVAAMERWDKDRTVQVLARVDSGREKGLFEKDRFEKIASIKDRRDLFDSLERLLAGDPSLNVALFEKLIEGSDKPWLKGGGADDEELVGGIDPMLAAYREGLSLLMAHIYRCVVMAARRVEDLSNRIAAGQNLKTYDEITGVVYDAVVSRPQLRASIAADYPVALVDEFQDTSLKQSTIFLDLYSHDKAKSLVLIGDPKQAIYGFRGGDVHAYARARSRIPPANQFRLGQSYRSTASYLDAVNQLFDAKRDPFLSQDESAAIEYEPVTAGAGWENRVGRPSNLAAVRVIDLSTGKSVKGWPSTWVPAVANHVKALLNGPSRLPGDDGKLRRVRPDDIAILTRTNNGATAIYQELTKAGLPAQSQVELGIFASDEAIDVLTFLDACGDPGSESRVRAAVVTDLVGRTYEDLESYRADGDRWQNEMLRFQDFASQWADGGVLAPLYSQVAERAAAKLTEPGGSRTVTNWLQLAELCQDAMSRHPNPASLIDWLRTSIAQSPNVVSDTIDTEQLRLETDEPSIRVVTMHKSKGLEYPIVIVADPWSALYRLRPHKLERLTEGPLGYRDSDGQRRVDLAADSEKRSDRASSRFIEELQEDLRLGYVALTRAKYHAAFCWADKWWGGHVDESGFHWLVCDDQIRSTTGRFAKAKRIDHMSRLKSLATTHNETFEIIPVAAISREIQPLTVVPDAGAELEARPLGSIAPDFWSSLSFSSIKRGAQGDAHEVERVDPDEAVIEPVKPSANDQPALSLAGGSAYGNAFHELLEDAMNERIFDTAAGLELTAAKLLRFGIAPKSATVEQTWARAELVMTRQFENQIVLANLPVASQVSEMEFHLDMPRTRTSELARVLRRHGDRFAATADMLDNRSIPLQGLLHGLIDLTFEHDGRYYLVDYKTTWLGETLGHYNRESMDRAMADHHYDLQYLIYTVAAHRWISGLRPDYEYEAHFGGVLYLFVRGMSVTGEEGVWFEKPDAALVADLTQVLTGARQ